MRRILVVENDRISRDLASAVLTKGGYDVVCARDGEEALEVAPDLGADLVQPVACRARRQCSNVILLDEPPPQRLLIFRRLPIHAQDELARSDEPFRGAVALQTPPHL